MKGEKLKEYLRSMFREARAPVVKAPEPKKVDKATLRAKKTRESREKAMTDAERARKYRLRNREKVLQRDRIRKRRAREKPDE